MNSRTREGKAAAAIFLLTAAALLAFHGNRVVNTNDEGIILEPAQRMLTGARPYVDFFAYMSPGSYWLQTIVFHLLGTSLIAGRVMVILDLSLQSALVFWITARLASWKPALAVVLIFTGFQMADPSFLTAQHRWDSATLLLAGVAVAISASRNWEFFAAGALFAAAAWCTPATAAVGAAVALWLLLTPERRKSLLPFAAGIAAITAAAVFELAREHALRGFVQQIVWLQHNYGEVNVMPYGSIIGGYRALFEGASGVLDISIRALLVSCLALPAILPPVAVLLSLWTLRTRRVPDRLRPAIHLLLLASVASTLTVFPRADVQHLAFVDAIPYILVATLAVWTVPIRIRFAGTALMIVLAAIFGANFFNTLRGTTRVPSAVGELRVPAEQADALRSLIAQVHPGEGLFVYPYMPIDYFLTQAKNPSRFSFLAPGMMTDREASAALTDLQARPPEWLLYLKLSREEFLRVFPHASNLDWRYEALENWLNGNYQPFTNPGVTVSGYQLWQRTDRAQARRQ